MIPLDDDRSGVVKNLEHATVGETGLEMPARRSSPMSGETSGSRIR